MSITWCGCRRRGGLIEDFSFRHPSRYRAIMKRGNSKSAWRPGEGPEITETEGEFVKVRKKALERLTTEVMQLHDILPQVLTGDILENFQKLDVVEALVEKKEHEVEQLRMDCEHFKARLETAQADCMKERKVDDDVLIQCKYQRERLEVHL